MRRRLLSARSVNALVGWVSSLLGVRSTTTVPRLENAKEQSDSHKTVEMEPEAVVAGDTGVNLQAGIVKLTVVFSDKMQTLQPNRVEPIMTVRWLTQRFAAE